jgi:hypothetical protein
VADFLSSFARTPSHENALAVFVGREHELKFEFVLHSLPDRLKRGASSWSRQARQRARGEPKEFASRRRSYANAGGATKP